jgi:hypothetical protein
VLPLFLWYVFHLQALTCLVSYCGCYSCEVISSAMDQLHKLIDWKVCLDLKFITSLSLAPWAIIDFGMVQPAAMGKSRWAVLHQNAILAGQDIKLSTRLF